MWCPIIVKDGCHLYQEFPTLYSIIIKEKNGIRHVFLRIVSRANKKRRARLRESIRLHAGRQGSVHQEAPALHPVIKRRDWRVSPITQGGWVCSSPHNLREPAHSDICSGREFSTSRMLTRFLVNFINVVVLTSLLISYGKADCRSLCSLCSQVSPIIQGGRLGLVQLRLYFVILNGNQNESTSKTFP